MADRGRDDDDLAATREHQIGSDNLFGSVVPALHDDIGLEMSDEIERCVVVEDDHEVDDFEGPEHERSIGDAAYRTIRPFEASNRVIAVDADDEGIASCASTAQHVDVPGVQQVEDAVREDDSPGCRAAPGRGVVPAHDLACGIEATQ